MDGVHENVTIEILSWLPVKSLCRFKSVCRSWHAIIRSPYFIYKHVNRNKNRHVGCLIAQFYCPVGYKSGVLMSQKLLLNRKRQRDLDSDFKAWKEPPNDYQVCGPCDGIYYLCRSNMSYGLDKSYLWNPSIREIRHLPPIIMKPNLPSNYIIKYDDHYCGFGFDPVAVDYKVVVIQAYKKLTGDDEDYPLSIIVYSLRTHCWKYVGDLSKRYYLGDNTCHTFVDSSYYWLGSLDRSAMTYQVVISQDLATNITQEIELPKSRIKGSITPESYFESLMVYHSSIALVTLYRCEYNFDIWTLKNRRWKNELNVKLDCRVDKPLYHHCGKYKLVFFGGLRGLILCDPCSGETQKFPMKLMEQLQHSTCKIINTYMESLIPLNDEYFWKSKKRRQEDHIMIK